jgi:predicted DNA binding CopG/RHH family protein
MAGSNTKPRKIVGFSLTPDLASEVKQEAARRGLSLKKLFEEMWETYKTGQKS